MTLRNTFAILISLSFIVGCSTKKPKTPRRAPTAVKVSHVTVKDIDHYIDTVGHMEAYQTVAIQAQVSGYLEEILFDDGSDVEEGKLLYIIDQRPYMAALDKALGTYDRYSAQLQYAKDTLIRNSDLVKKNYISQNTYEKYIADTMATEGLVKQSQAEVEQAKINVGFTKIYAPISARAGFTHVYKGDLISENSTSNMVELNQIIPIYATFFLAGHHLPLIQKYQDDSQPLSVSVQVDHDTRSPYFGKLTFINNQIDLATGMIQLKATLNNGNKNLWPNQYVKIKVILNTIKEALLVPLSCVEKTPKGDLVYTVNDSFQVEIQPVTVGQLQKGNMIHIKQGLKTNDLVITSGQLTLYPGALVSIKNRNDHAHNQH